VFGLESVMAQQNDDRRTLIMENAARLLADAKLLVDHNRFASAFALAVLGVEEIGKVVLDIWETEKPLTKPATRKSSHLRKQAAVGSVLLASFAMKEFGVIVEISIPDDLVESVAKAFHGSIEGRLLRHIEIGAVERTKHLAMYRDEWLTEASLHANQFEKSDVTGLFEYARSAIAVLGDGHAMRTARAIYETRN
jgi:AbiV family abortive infection protein